MLEKPPQHGPSFEICGSRIRCHGGRDWHRGEHTCQLRGGTWADSCSYHGCVTVFIDAYDRRRLDANIDREPQRSEGDHPKQHGKEHGAVGVGPKHAIVFVVLRVGRDLCTRFSILGQSSLQHSKCLALSSATSPFRR